MAIQAMMERFRRTLRELRTANGANVTITFALVTIPMVGFVGAAVDYSHANSVKAAMQAAADSTALMLSKEAATLSSASFQTKANDYFKALFTRPEATGLVVSATYTNTSGSQVVVNASSNVKANFMGLMGVSTMKVAASSEVKWGNTRMRVALVLDNTGSMADSGKITALQTATKNLLNQLKSAVVNNGDVYVSIIPFVKDVNVGASNYNATWIDWTDWDQNNGTCSQSSHNGDKAGCQSAGKTWTGANHNTWGGCVTDRGKPGVNGNNSAGPSTGNYDTNVTTPTTSTKATLFPAEQYSPCPQKVMPLSYDWTGMTNLVNAMSPGGGTNQNIGLVHGWQSLVGGGPYPAPPAMDPNYNYSQVIILLTDGLNTQDRWPAYGNGTTQFNGSIDARQTMTCANAKAAGITLYMIQVNTSGDPTSTLLKNCATDASKFFLLTSATEIVTTFNTIGNALSNRRIAQ
jgi:Flp pilus assembly protein TadG